MLIALTGATGFLGRYIATRLASAGHSIRAWHRSTSDRTGLEDLNIGWLEGELGEAGAAEELVDGCQVLVHGALSYLRDSRMQGRGFTTQLALNNIAGSLQLFEAAKAAGVERVIFISSCAVHDDILSDRPLDETHPLWPRSDYGAHKAAIEAFVHSLGRGDGYPICALRPTGIYGLAHPVSDSKWFNLVSAVIRGEPVTCRQGGKEVHALDVARAVELLLTAPDIAGQAYNCYDRYVSHYEVAMLAQAIGASSAPITGEITQPKHEIATGKLRALGMTFGGESLLQHTVAGLVAAARRQ